tara:strand:+ start:1291 stop:2604 length:1314 start_codon:yes stop_codon:yes gene_type:complete
MIKKFHVVIGGGIAGICTSLFLARKNESVLLVEKGSSLGGLLKSTSPFENEFHFDYGTHFIAQTGNEELDNLLFKNIELNQYDYLKVGSFYENLFEGNGFVTDFHLSKRNEYFDQINLRDRNQEANNLYDQLAGSFGEGYTNNLFDPILKKFFGYTSKKLKPDSHKLFGLNRIITSSKEKVDQLKTSNAYYNDLLAFHSYKQGQSKLKALYPKNNGIGKWIDHLVKQLETKGVEIMLNASLEKINAYQNKIKSVTIDNKEFNIDQLYWTAPSVFIYPYFKLKTQTFLSRLRSYLVHFVVDKDYLTSLYYFQCFDPSFNTFRVTLYDNFSSPCHENNRRITVEVLLKEDQEINNNFNQKLFNELIQMKVIPHDTNVLHEKNLIIPNSFPILKNDFYRNQPPEDQLTKNFNNLHFFGKAYSKKWFMSEVIEEIYKKVND